MVERHKRGLQQVHQVKSNSGKQITTKGASKLSLFSASLVNESLSHTSSDDDSDTEVSDCASPAPPLPQTLANNITREPSSEEADPLLVIAESERVSLLQLEETQELTPLLGHDRDHYDVKYELLKLDSYSNLHQQINNPMGASLGSLVSCTQSYGHLFVTGHECGMIRLFDLTKQSSDHMKPLVVPQKQVAQGSRRVTCLDVIGFHLCAGHSSGAVALWDLRTYTLIKAITTVHQSEVIAARIFNVAQVISIVSVEKTGPVFHTDVTPGGYLYGSTFVKNVIFNKRLKTPTDIAIFRQQQNPYWLSKSLIAIAAHSEVVVCSMRPIQELIRIKKPAFCAQDKAPSVSFGHGLTPSKQDRSVALLALAWGPMVQIVYFDDETV